MLYHPREISRGGQFCGKFGGNFAGFFRTHKIEALEYRGRFWRTFREKIRASQKKLSCQLRSAKITQYMIPRALVLQAHDVVRCDHFRHFLVFRKASCSRRRSHHLMEGTASFPMQPKPRGCKTFAGRCSTRWVSSLGPLLVFKLRSRPPFTGVLLGPGPESAPRSVFWAILGTCLGVPQRVLFKCFLAFLGPKNAKKHSKSTLWGTPRQVPKIAQKALRGGLSGPGPKSTPVNGGRDRNLQV